jgi:ubiquinone/menaquinone biosynthesis C-methylase UbiE
MPAMKPVNLWTSNDHARDYLERADSISHRQEGESALLEFIPPTTRRILDLGTGDGRLLSLVRSQHPNTEAVAIDFSPTMLEAAGKRFAAESSVSVIAHNLDDSLPALGKFDAVISSFAIHHVVHERKQSLYAEIYASLNPGGVFCNLEHVASPTPRLHKEFLERIGFTVETEDPSNKLLDLETQLGWLREISFVDVDCHWKWRELALLVGRRP